MTSSARSAHPSTSSRNEGTVPGQPAVFQRGGDAQAVENIHHRGIGHLHAEQGVDAVRRDMDGAGLGQTLMPVDGALHNVASV